jgi:hypothetical protein
MLTDGASVSVPTVTTTNVIVNHPLEFIGSPSVARLLISADAALLSMQFLINVGGTQAVPIAAGSNVNVASVAGAGPKDDEDTVANGVPLPAGSRNQWNVTNPTGGAVVVRWRAYIAP